MNYHVRRSSHKFSAKSITKTSAKQRKSQLAKMANQAARETVNDETKMNGGEEFPSGNNELCPSLTKTSDDPIEQQAGSSASASEKKCANCHKAESDPEKPLKPCSKCQSVNYCSRDCQKLGWKQHKKTCATAAQIYAQTANLKMAAPSVPKKDGHRGGLQKWQFDT
jgi:hypothetical protein